MSVVAGGLAQALAKARAVSTQALASPHRSRRHASSLQAVGTGDASEAGSGGASSSTVYSGALVQQLSRTREGKHCTAMINWSFDVPT